MRRSESNKQLEREHQSDQRFRNFRREMIGIGLGVGLALMISSLIPFVRELVSISVVVLWGGAIGGVIASLKRFEKAGAVLTKSESRPLNYAVGFGVPLVILIVLFLLGR